MSIDKIKEMYHELIECIRHEVSIKLMDNNMKDVWIPLEHNAVGVSTLEMPTIDKIYQDSKKGIIIIHYHGDEDDIFSNWNTLDSADMIQILEYFENPNNWKEK